MSENSLQKNFLKTLGDFFARIRSFNGVPLICRIQHTEQSECCQLRIDVMDTILLRDVGYHLCRHTNVGFLAAIDSSPVLRRKRLALMQKTRDFEIALLEHKTEMQ